MDRRAVQVEPEEFQAYRDSWQTSAAGTDVASAMDRSAARRTRVSKCSCWGRGACVSRVRGLGRASSEEKAGLGCNLEKTVTGDHVVCGVKPGGKPLCCRALVCANSRASPRSEPLGVGASRSVH